MGSELNTDVTHDARQPAILDIGGIPFVAFLEFDPTEGHEHLIVKSFQ